MEEEEHANAKRLMKLSLHTSSSSSLEVENPGALAEQDSQARGLDPNLIDTSGWRGTEYEISLAQELKGLGENLRTKSGEQALASQGISAKSLSDQALEQGIS